MEVDICNKKYPLRIIRKKVKRYSLRVNTLLEIVLTINRSISDKQVIAIIENNKEWLHKTIEKMSSSFSLINLDDFKCFHQTYFLGKVYKLSLSQNNNENEIFVHAFSKEEIIAFLCQKDSLLLEAFDQIIKQYNFKDVTVSLKFYKSRWGCCSCKKRHIILNRYLMQLPIYLINFVILHELTHLSVSNHSYRFYEVLAAYEPKYKTYREELKKYSFLLNI